MSRCVVVFMLLRKRKDQWLDDTNAANKTCDSVRDRENEVHGKEDDGGRDIISLEEDDDQGLQGVGNGPLHWVPYVHFGA